MSWLRLRLYILILGVGGVFKPEDERGEEEEEE